MSPKARCAFSITRLVVIKGRIKASGWCSLILRKPLKAATVRSGNHSAPSLSNSANSAVYTHTHTHTHIHTHTHTQYMYIYLYIHIYM